MPWKTVIRKSPCGGEYESEEWVDEPEIEEEPIEVTKEFEKVLVPVENS